MKRSSQIILIALFLIALAPAAFAIEHTIGLRGGVTLPMTDLDEETSTDLMLGLSYEAWLKDYLSLGIYPYYTSMSGQLDETDPILHSDFDATLIGADLLLKLRPVKGPVLNFHSGALKRIAPFVDLGLGLVNFQTEGVTYQTPSKAVFDENEITLVAPSLGAGLSFLTKWNVNLDLGVQLDHAWNDKIDNLDKDDLPYDMYVMPYLGLGYTFGSKKASSASYPRRILRNVVSMKEDFTLEGVQFEFDSSKLTSEAMPVLDEVVVAMKKYPEVKMGLHGHTDSVGDDAYNMKLSQERAESVKAYLVGQGIAPERLTTKGYGETMPVASNDTPEGRAENRRIEFVIAK